MAERVGGVLGEVAGWLALPAVPAVLATTYLGVVSFGQNPDPRLWIGWDWPVRLGPLLGFGFLAGATLGRPDPTSRQGGRSWTARRAAWVAVGPWVGLLFWAGVYYALAAANWVREALLPASWFEGWSLPTIQDSWLVGTILGTLSHGWLVVAWFALWRARRLRRLGQALGRGLAVAAAFVGSLLGGFWAVTATWRGYFFDTRLAPAGLVAAAGLIVCGGCAAQPTVGEVRRRELFQAMVMAWVIGLALAWRWWGRSARRSGASGGRQPHRKQEKEELLW